MDPHINDEQFDKALEKTLREKDIRRFRDAARQAMEEVKKEAPRPRLSPVFVAVQIAAGLLILLAAIWWWRISASQTNLEQLTNDLLVEYDKGIDPLEQSVRGEEQELNEVIPARWRELDSLYNAGDYRSALSRLDQLQAADPAFEVISRPEWTFYHGTCYLRLGEPKTALQWLEQVERPFLEKATFFRAIALIKLDREEEARAVLQSIVDTPSHYYKEPAAELLKVVK
jgi:tetratricopeptide (TPR) repeat protein